MQAATWEPFLTDSYLSLASNSITDFTSQNSEDLPQERKNVLLQSILRTLY